MGQQIERVKKLISKDKLNEMFKDAEGIEKEEAIVRAMVKYKISQDDAAEYYAEWKNSYMKSTNNASLKPNKNTKIQKKIRTEPKATIRLDIIGVTLTGENGTYKLCKDGLELSDEGQTLSFKNVYQWENFKAEIDRAFEFGKSSKVLGS